jgi:hypothetical protein
MSIFIIEVKDQNGAPMRWYFDSASEHKRALRMASESGRSVVDHGSDVITDADEFGEWMATHQTEAALMLREPDATGGNSQPFAEPARVPDLVRIACRALEDNHVSELTRDDLPPEENKAMRDCAVSNAIEDAADTMGLELPAMGDELGAVYATVHEYADANWPKTYGEDDDGRAVPLIEVEQDEDGGWGWYCEAIGGAGGFATRELAEADARRRGGAA